jgi:CheY-like chemotaxis protein
MMQPLRICIVEPTPFLAKQLVRDITHLGIVTEDISFATTYRAAVSLIQKKNPHIILLSLDMPNDGAFRLMQNFNPEEHPFLVVLLSTPALDKYLLPSFMKEFYCAGYLVKGKFGNTMFLKTLEIVRHDLQTSLLQRYKAEILEAVTPTIPDALSSCSKQSNIPLGNISKKVKDKSRKAASFLALYKHNNEKVKKEILWESVTYCHSAGNYLNIYYVTDEKKQDVQSVVVLRKSVTIPDEFMKLSRSYWVHKKYIADILDNGLRLMTGEILPISVRNRQIVIQTLESYSMPFVIANEVIRALVAQKTQ